MPATDEESTTIHRLEAQVVEINTTLEFIKGIGYILAASALASFWAILGAVYRAGPIEKSVAEGGANSQSPP